MHSLTLYTNIKGLVNVRAESRQLRGTELGSLPVIENAFLFTDLDRIADYGPMSELPGKEFEQLANRIDLSGCFVLPAWCDSHTHTVFAAPREQEFIMKLKGMSYADIAASGGGILNSAAKLGGTSEDDLYESAMQRLREMAANGTGSVEIKSGYGLSTEGELKMLRVIKRLRKEAPQCIKATFLAGHAYPAAYKSNHSGYIDKVINEMMPVVARENLADFVDVFIEDGFFNTEEADRIIEAAEQYGLQPKLHVNQLSSCGGIELGIRRRAVSLDHLETLTSAEIDSLGKFKGAATLLPTAAFFLRMPMQPARALLEAGAAVTLASDFNPGSSPSGNMNFVCALAAIQMKMLPEEVINAATINGAFAMNLGDESGSISTGKRADFIITKEIPSLAYLFYAFGDNHIKDVVLSGRKFSMI